MLHTNGKPAGTVMQFFPEGAGQSLTVTLPVAAEGYYRVAGIHVYGSYNQGRYGLYRVAVDGVPLPGKFHGWYGSEGAPKRWPKAKVHMIDVDWGVIYLRVPSVRLTFQPTTDGLLGTESLTLVPVSADKLKPEDRAARCRSGRRRSRRHRSRPGRPPAR